jgi:hypothetical protein
VASSNRRLFYACEAAAIAPESTRSYTRLYGVQSCGVDTSFDVDSVFQLGQLSQYATPEALPQVQVTLEKVLDGRPLIGHHATEGAVSADLVGRSTKRCSLALSTFADTVLAASGSPVSALEMSGMFLSSWSFRFPSEGNFTEQCELQGNNKLWITPVSGAPFTGGFTTSGVPYAPEGVNRRQHFDMASSLFPTEIPGISGDGTNHHQASLGKYAVSFANVSVSTNLNRTDLNELGRKGPYFKFVPFPVECTTEFEVISTEGDGISATEEGVLENGDNLTAHRIYLAVEEGTKIDMGSANKLTRVSHTGGDAQQNGSNVTVTYAYRNYNDMRVTHPLDPTTALAE